MDAVLAKVEGAATGVELLIVLAELQKLMVEPGGLEVARADAGKLALIAGVTAWREGHDAPEWTQVTAMVFGEVLKAFDKAVGVVAVEVAAAAAAAAEAAAAAAAAAEAAEAAAAPVLAAQLAASRVRVEELEKINEDLSAELEERDAARAKELETNKELADKIRELEARQEAQEAERKEEVDELKEQVRDREEQLRDLVKTHAANMEAARQGLRQQEAARQAVVRRRQSEEADAAAPGAAAGGAGGKAKGGKQEKKKKGGKKGGDAKPKQEQKAAEKKPETIKDRMNKLPKSSLTIDEWKRTFSGVDRTEASQRTAFEWFTENMDWDGYSLFIQEYKYNDENKMSFMTCNGVKGFQQRTEEMRKYAFGMMHVVGEEGPFKVRGAWLVRGSSMDDFIQANDECEYYTWTKVAKDDAAALAAVNDCWSAGWSEGSTLDGVLIYDSFEFK